MYSIEIRAVLDIIAIHEEAIADLNYWLERKATEYETADTNKRRYLTRNANEAARKIAEREALIEAERAIIEGLLADNVNTKESKTMDTKKQLFINIGLEQGAAYYDPKGYLNGSEKQPLERVLSLLGRVLPDLKLERVVKATSNTEETLVIKAHTHGNMDKVQRSLDTLSGLLGQQAIAFTLDGTGAMAKHPTEPPRDSSWLIFNPEYFLIAGLPVSLEQYTE